MTFSTYSYLQVCTVHKIIWYMCNSGGTGEFSPLCCSKCSLQRLRHPVAEAPELQALPAPGTGRCHPKNCRHLHLSLPNLPVNPAVIGHHEVCWDPHGHLSSILAIAIAGLVVFVQYLECDSENCCSYSRGKGEGI